METARELNLGTLPYAVPERDSSIPVSEQRTKVLDLIVAFGAFGDMLLLTVGMLFGYWVRVNAISLPVPVPHTTAYYARQIVFGTISCQCFMLYVGLYKPSCILWFRRSANLIVKGCTLWMLSYIILTLFVASSPTILQRTVFFSWAINIGLLILWRWALAKFTHQTDIARQLCQHIILAGWSPDAQRLCQKIATETQQPYHIVGWVEAAGEQNQPAPKNIPCLGTFENLPHLIETRAADIIILASPNWSPADINRLNHQCTRALVKFKIIPSYFQILISGLHLHDICGVPLLGVSALPLGFRMNRFLKRTTDIFGALVGLVASAPIIAVCSFLVYRESPGPVFHRQIRMGRNGRHFTLLKIRSMHLNAEAQGVGWTQPNDRRCLRIGKLMRAWNLDEVPQFWNILKGDMSLVGPRPERPELISKFKDNIPYYNARHVSKPGLTGWAQINGLRGDTSISDRVQYDLYYLENWSLWLDAKIMLSTFWNRKNAY